jgi:hypothetical protein
VKTWFRAYALHCGGCGARLEGVPCLAITGAGWQLYRCATCAGTPAPADDDPSLPSTPPDRERRPNDHA